MCGKRCRISRLLSLTLCLTLLFTFVPMTRPVKTNAFILSDAENAMRAFNNKFWDPDAKYFWNDTNHGNNYQGFWVEAELWEMVMDAYINTSNQDLKY